MSIQTFVLPDVSPCSSEPPPKKTPTAEVRAEKRRLKRAADERERIHRAGAREQGRLLKRALREQIRNDARLARLLRKHDRWWRLLQEKQARQKEIRDELRRRRRDKTIGRCDSGESLEERAAWTAGEYAPVALHSRFPSVSEWAELYKLGYPKESITTSLGIPKATSDRSKRCVVEYEVDGNDSETGKAEVMETAKDYCGIAQPDHPYLPSAAARYTFEDGGYSTRQIEAGLRRMRCPATTKEDLRLRLAKGWTTRQLMQKRRIRKERFAAYSNHLRTYTKRLKAHIRAIFGDSRAT